MSQQYPQENFEEYPAPRWVQDPDGFYHDTQPEMAPIEREPKREAGPMLKLMSAVGATVIVAGLVILVCVIILAAIIWVIGKMV